MGGCVTEIAAAVSKGWGRTHPTAIPQKCPKCPRIIHPKDRRLAHVPAGSCSPLAGGCFKGINFRPSFLEGPVDPLRIRESPGLGRGKMQERTLEGPVVRMRGFQAPTTLHHSCLCSQRWTQGV